MQFRCQSFPIGDSLLAGMELLASKGASKGPARNELVRLTSLLGSLALFDAEHLHHKERDGEHGHDGDRPQMRMMREAARRRPHDVLVRGDDGHEHGLRAG